MPLSIFTANDDEAHAIARRVYMHADRLIDVQVNNGIVDIVCDPNEEAEVMQQLTRVGILNIIAM